MDPVHDRGSMDPVQRGVHGPLVHVLSSPVWRSSSALKVYSLFKQPQAGEEFCHFFLQNVYSMGHLFAIVLCVFFSMSGSVRQFKWLHYRHSPSKNRELGKTGGNELRLKNSDMIFPFSHREVSKI